MKWAQIIRHDLQWLSFCKRIAAQSSLLTKETQDYSRWEKVPSHKSFQRDASTDCYLLLLSVMEETDMPFSVVWSINDAFWNGIHEKRGLGWWVWVFSGVCWTNRPLLGFRTPAPLELTVLSSNYTEWCHFGIRPTQRNLLRLEHFFHYTPCMHSYLQYFQKKKKNQEHTVPITCTCDFFFYFFFNIRLFQNLW